MFIIHNLNFKLLFVGSEPVLRTKNAYSNPVHVRVACKKIISLTNATREI